MTEVTIENFEEILPKFAEELEKCRFVSIDLEFTCLNASKKVQNSIFDTPAERYRKLRATVEKVIPLQIGVTLFAFDADDYSYHGSTYTFYTFPKSFLSIDTNFTCSTASFQFLINYNFDFSKCIYHGIPFLNREQEKVLAVDLKSHYYDDMVFELRRLLTTNRTIVEEWLNTAMENDCMFLENYDIFKKNLSFSYLLHQELRKSFPNVWTDEDGGGFKVERVSLEKLEQLKTEYNLERKYTSIMLGFTKVFRLLVSSQKPLVGHNVLLDLHMLVDKFESPLPKSYEDFKKLVHQLFPVVFDTKSLCFDLRRKIPDDKCFTSTSLEELYSYFRNEVGRHIAANSPYIQANGVLLPNFHNAGWDSYCTGYIFIRMAHIISKQNEPTRKKFMSSELIKGLSSFSNRINVIKGNLSYIQLDGSDPVSKRPPWLIVEALENKPLDINQVSCLLNMHGYVEVKPFSYNGHRAIVAVDNFYSAKRILRHFKSNTDFSIQSYSILRHSPVAKSFLWSGVLVSGILVAWYGLFKAQ